MIQKEIIELFRVPPGKRLRLKDHDPGWAQTKEMKELGKEEVKKRAQESMEEDLEKLAQAQELLYADDRYGVLMILHA